MTRKPNWLIQRKSSLGLIRFDLNQGTSTERIRTKMMDKFDEKRELRLDNPSKTPEGRVVKVLPDMQNGTMKKKEGKKKKKQQ